MSARRVQRRYLPGSRIWALPGRLIAVAAVLAVGLLPASWALLASPASAASATQLSITASGGTTVGLQVFANVNLFGGTNPSGNITFRLFSPHDTSCTSAIFTSTVAVTGTSINSGRWTTTAAGTYHWEASYSGDGANSPSGPTACSQPAAAVVVSPAATALSVTAEAPTSGGVLRASAALSGTAHPTGTVTFSLSPPGDTFCSTTLFTSTVAVQGAGNYSSAAYSPTVTGSYKWRASYSGDANNSLSPVTACLSPGDAVTVSSVVAPAHPTTTSTTRAPVGATRTTSTTAPSGAAGPASAPATGTAATTGTGATTGTASNGTAASASTGTAATGTAATGATTPVPPGGGAHPTLSPHASTAPAPAGPEALAAAKAPGTGPGGPPWALVAAALVIVLIAVAVTAGLLTRSGRVTASGRSPRRTNHWS